ncbi:AbrB/MazE/SpoVT family DNA-binding domain-containing protein [Metabacillus idriensis]|uniref:AbrB/MazE/SpoVT family DNA-binding domain-containing protein n=1 Tax=Metabacillus idriensis TaxID=324768 RepID=UPI001748D654|nr:AbrB/MazE/SpoVT family DNA-binding domain-containing protein [Metabacillus idriensis]
MQVNHDAAAVRIVELRTGGKITVPKPFRDMFLKDDRLVEISIKEGKYIVLHEFDYVKRTSNNLKLIGSRKIDLKGCLVIPNKARLALGIHEKDYLELHQEGEQIIKKYITNK